MGSLQKEDIRLHRKYDMGHTRYRLEKYYSNGKWKCY